MRSRGHRAERERRPGLQDLANAFGLCLEFGSAAGIERAEGVDRDVDPGTGAAMVPDARDHAVDENGRDGTGLSSVQRPFGRLAGEHTRTGMTPDNVRIEVRHQSWPAVEGFVYVARIVVRQV